LKSQKGIDKRALNALGTLSSNLLDVDAAFRAGHDHVLAAGTVQRDAKIELLGDVDRRCDQDLPYRMATNVKAEDAFGRRASFTGRAGQ
jgi:hypothetical protein